MRIAIEAQRIMRQKKHGMDMVIIEVIKQLQKIDLENEYFIITNNDKYCPIKETHNFHVIKGGCSFYPLWEQIVLPYIVNKIKPDILHCTSNTAPKFCNVPTILTLHDVIFMEKSKEENASSYQRAGRIYRRLVVPLILNKCKKIITVSEYEKDVISNVFPKIEDKIASVYNGYSEHFYKKESLQELDQILDNELKTKEYIFFLGNTDPKKNTVGTIIGYANYARKSKTPAKLLIADLSKDVLNDIIVKNNLQDISHLIIVKDYIPNDKLPYIYSSAFALLYTSYRESFGIPLLEGMACGIPVVTSSVSALPEVAGHGGVFANPYNTDDITNKLLELETNPQYRELAVEYGLKRVKNFSWGKTAEEYLKIYTQVNIESRNGKVV